MAASLLEVVFEAFPDYYRMMEILEKSSIVVNEKEFSCLEGYILEQLTAKTENVEEKMTYLLGSFESDLKISSVYLYSAAVFSFKIANILDSEFYYRKSIAKARKGLCVLESDSESDDDKEELNNIIIHAEAKIKNCVWKPRIKAEETRVQKGYALCIDLRLYWQSLNVEIKRIWMNVSIADFENYVKDSYGKDGPKDTHKKAQKEVQKTLDQVFTYARKHKKWKLWFCRTCLKRFSTSQDCKDHLEEDHAAKFKPSSINDIPQRISDVWANMISAGGWEPVDAVTATEMIKNQLTNVKAFAYENGWSRDWPSAVDEERSKLLKEVHLLLLSYCVRKILSCSIRDWLMHFVANQLEKFEVSNDVLTDCRLVETPQGICFLECHDLNQIVASLRKIKCDGNDEEDMINRAVDNVYGSTRYKEKIDFDTDFSVMLLDKRLLNCKITRFDDEGTIKHFDPNVHYAKVPVCEDNFLSWLADYYSGHERFQFPRPIREHNLVIWVAVLRAIQFKCRCLESKYTKKLQFQDYGKALSDVRKLCIIEANNWKRYASLLCDRCGEGDAAETFLCAARDVLEQSSYPTFDSEDCHNVIHERKNLSNDLVLKSIEHLKSEVNNKIAVLDSKILLIESARISLLNDLTRLAEFDR